MIKTKGRPVIIKKPIKPIKINFIVNLNDC